jgi:ABC-type sugar transport system permease subunit
MKNSRAGKGRGFLGELRRNRILFLMLLPAIVYFLIFNYVPMAGVYLAFTRFSHRTGLFRSPFVGFANFKLLIDQGTFEYLTRNTNVGCHNDFGFIYPNQFAGHPWTGNPPDIWDQYRKYNAGLLVSKAFGFTFNSTPVANEEAQLKEYRNDLVFGAVDIETRLREFNRALYGAGLQRVIDEKQKQLDAWLSKKK